MLWDRRKIRFLPLRDRESKTAIEKIASFSAPSLASAEKEKIHEIAKALGKAKEKGAARILVYGAHLVKNGLGPLVRAMVEEGYLTHLATNGAGTIHDWEFAYQGKSEEDVRKYLEKGQFGLWEETGFYINLALLLGATRNEGYGESIGRLIHEEKLVLPTKVEMQEKISLYLRENPRLALGWSALYEASQRMDLPTGTIAIAHPFQKYSICEAAFRNSVPLTVHPGFGYDIIYSHPLNSGAAIGLTAETDFLRFVESVSHLDEGVYLSVGSAIMSPMILEKSLSMVRNVARQKGEKRENFYLVVNDIQEGAWDWGTGTEPSKKDPAYYLRFCKSFDRMSARHMDYICADNRAFLGNLYEELQKLSQTQ